MIDPRPVACQLYDLDDKRIGELFLAPRLVDQPARVIVWHGRKFREGDASGFYHSNQFGELPDDKRGLDGDLISDKLTDGTAPVVKELPA